MSTQNNSYQYLPSDKVDVFPISFKRDDYPSATILTEYNILKLIKSSAGSDNYVISSNQYISSAQGAKGAIMLEFVIAGYYFNIDISEYLQNITTNMQNEGVTTYRIFAHLWIDQGAPLTPLLVGYDDPPNGNSYFKGLALELVPVTNDSLSISESGTPGTPSGIKEEQHIYEQHTLMLLEHTGTGFYIPHRSRRRLDGGVE